MRRLFLTSLLLLLGGGTAVLLHSAVFAPGAAAEKCITCEIEEPGEEVEAQFLTIEIAGGGAVGDGTKTYCENATAGSKTCEVELAEGKEVTLSATPKGEYVFQGWSGACSGNGSCEVTMDEAKFVKATFHNPPPASPTITSPTNGQVFEWTAEESISVSFSDGDPTVVGFSCGLDFGSMTPCTSPWKTPTLKSGEHTVTVFARDGGGNLASSSRTVKVVINPPAGEEEGGSGGEEEKEPPKEEGGSGSGGGTPSGGVATGATTSPPPPPAVAPAIAARAVVKSHLLGSATVLRKLALKGLPAGASVAATCKGKGCPFKRKQVKVAGGTADLTALFAKRQLAAGTLIELKATAPGMTGETIDIKTRAGKAPKVTTS